MQELLKIIAQGLVEKPEEVSVTLDEPKEDGSVVYHLHVAEEDMGRVIGKQGRIAKAIRAVVKAAASKEDKKVIIGVRPEHIIVTPNEKGKIALQIVETLGSELLLHFNISENTSLCAKVITNDVIKAGQKVNFTFNADFLHVFDSETEVAYF